MNYLIGLLSLVLSFWAFRKNVVIVLFFLLWLPIQNLVLVLLSSTSALSFDEANTLGSAKDYVLIVLLLLFLLRHSFQFDLTNKSLTGNVRAFFIIGIIYLLLPTYFLFGPELSMQVKIYGFRLIYGPLLLISLGSFLDISKSDVCRIYKLFLVYAILISVLTAIEYLFVPVEVSASAVKLLSPIKGHLNYDEAKDIYALARGDFGSWDIGGVRRLVSTFLNQQLISYYLVFPIALLFAEMLLNWAVERKIWWTRAVGLVFMLFIQMLTTGRGGVVATFISMFVIASALGYRRHLLIGSAFGIVFVMMYSEFTRNLVITTITLQDMSALGHFVAFLESLHNMILYPFGLGLGMGGYVAGNYTEIMKDYTIGAESFWFSASSQIGIIPIILYVIIYVKMSILLYRSIRNQISKQPTMSTYLLLGSLGTLIGVGVCGIVSESAFAFLPQGFFWLSFGLLISYQKRIESGLYL